VQAGQGSKLQWERIREHFHHAVELEPAEREIYLQSACGDDVLLRGEVRALLVEHDNATGLLATGPSDFQPHPTRFLLSPGDCLAGRFEIIRPLGAGGMGEVYEAHDRELGARVALKTLRPELVHDPKNRERFKHEILNGRKVTHPNICRIYDLAPDYSHEGTFLAFTMELLGGETLGAYLEQQPGKRLPVEEALPLARQMAAGLDALHAEDIIHRDFKPGNVILVRQGDSTQVRITDFGLARSTETPGQTLSGSKDIVGTPIYMAPEQLTGERAKVSPATDVYALGLVLYEMVTGARAYPAETLGENILQKTQGPPAPPRERYPGLDEKWNTAIQRCLEQEPEDRPGSPGEVVAALEGEVALPRLKGARSRKRTRDRAWADPHLRWGAAAAVLIFLALAASFLRQIGSEGRQRTVAVLPFEVLPGDPELSAFADGLMATITRRLTQFEGMNESLIVMAPSTVLGRGVADPAAAFEKLGVNYAVEGDFQASGERLVLTLTLVDTVEGHQLDTAIVTGLRGNALAIQEGAVRRLANMLDLRIQPEHLGPETAASEAELGAAQFYTAGVGYLQRSDVTANIENAITQFQRAIELDEEYALAYAGLCEAQWRLHERISDPKPLVEAQADCEKALQLNDQLPEAQIALGNVRLSTGKHEEAIRSFNSALELDARNAEALSGLARVFGRMGRVEQALAAYDQSIGLRPADWRTHHQLGLFHHGRRDYEAAIKPFQAVVDLTPRSAQALLNLGAAYHGAGRLREAQALYERAVEIEPRPYALSNLAKIYFDEGAYPQAKDTLERAVSLKEHDFILWQELASAYEYVEDPRVAQTYLKAASLIEQALRVNPEREELYSLLAHCYAGADEQGQAKEWLAKAAARRGVADRKELLWNAKTSARLGNPDAAFDWLGAAQERGLPRQEIERELKTRKWLRPLRDDPRTKDFIGSP